MAEQELKDISIIGGGPTGLFAAFYAGMRGASARIIDALPALGGQLMALYPEKYIFDVAGFPKVLAKDLVRDMAIQGLQFGATTHLGEIVTGLRRVEDGEGGHFVLETDGGDYPSRTIVIAAGIGAFEARRLGVAGEDAFEEKGLYFKVLDPKAFAGRRVLLVGGGDSAFDWAVNLQGVAESIMLIHRRDGFRAHAATISQVRGALPPGALRPPHVLGGEEDRGQREGRAGHHLQQQDQGRGDPRARRHHPAARLPLRPRAPSSSGGSTPRRRTSRSTS